MTSQKKVTQKQAEKVLQAVAEWMGKRGYGQEFDHEVPGAKKFDYGDGDVTWFLPVAPTGPEAARNGLGPQLVMDWDWPSSGPTPTILLEGGPYDWAIEIDLNDKALGVFTEPYAGYALCIYPEG
jgi:hypothetical protein